MIITYMLSSIENQGSFSGIKKELSSSLSSILKFSESEIFSLLEQPQNQQHGHLSLPLFSFAKLHKQNPKDLAEKMTLSVKNQNLPYLEKVEAISGFVNFKFNEDYILNQLNQLVSKKKLADFSLEDQEHWVMDFASPNVAKYMNIGHLRATVLGQALVNLSRQFGIKVTALNHLGDWGSQFGKLLWAYKEWGSEYNFKEQAFETLVQLYTRFHKEAENDPKKLKEATDLFQKLEQGDPSLKKLWKQFVDLSLKDYEKYWKSLNVKHDQILGESFYSQFLEDLKTRLNKKKLLQKSEGAEVVFLDDDLPPCLITKSDGASTYGARDLASAIYRFEKLKANKNIYITGADQNLHFKQIFQTLEKMQFSWSKACMHLSFGMYRFKGEGKMSTRKGQAIYLKDVIHQAIERVQKIIQGRRPELKNKDKISEQVGIGAIVFNDLINDRIKDVDFDWNKILDFDGSSGPFVQYTHVRCLSLLKKANCQLPRSFSKQMNSKITKEGSELIWFLLTFEEAIIQSFKHFKPHILARYLLDLSKKFNRFYASERILESEQKQDLILLVDTVRRILQKGLDILNIPTPSEM